MGDALVVTKGNDRTFSVTALDSGGLPADLTDAYLWFTAKYSINDEDAAAAIFKTSIDGITVNSPATDGLAHVALSAADTESLPSVAGRRGLVLQWDLKVLDSDDHLTTLASGTLVIAGNVTRALTP